MEHEISQPESAETVVVGGGIVGTSIAYFLTTERDHDVLLIEKDSIAAGSTGDSSAILRHHYGDDETYTKLARFGLDFYRSFEDRTGEPIALNDNHLAQFAQEGTDYADYNRGGYELMSSLNLPVEYLEHPDLKERYPMLNYLDDFDFGVVDRGAGYSDGSDAANGLARAASRNGATVLTGTAVEDFETESGEIKAVVTDRGSIECDQVVIAAGPWTKPLAKLVDIDVPIKVTREKVALLSPSSTFANEQLSRTPITSLPGGDCYMRPDFGDNILIATHQMNEEVNPDSTISPPDEEWLLKVGDLVAENVPSLADAGIQGSYSGLYSVTPDHNFILDKAGPTGCYIACGFSGHGFKHGPAIGKIMSDLIVEGETKLVDRERFRLDRFEEDPSGSRPPGGHF